MEILHKVVLYAVLAFVLVGGAVSLAGPGFSSEPAAADSKQETDDLEMAASKRPQIEDPAGT